MSEKVSNKVNLPIEDCLATVLRQLLLTHNSVAIPGFGTFQVEERPEYEAINPANGTPTLFPPALLVTFTPGSRLKKSVKA